MNLVFSSLLAVALIGTSLVAYQEGFDRGVSAQKDWVAAKEISVQKQLKKMHICEWAKIASTKAKCSDIKEPSE